MKREKKKQRYNAFKNKGEEARYEKTPNIKIKGTHHNAEKKMQ